jgi:hypothetical protein
MSERLAASLQDDTQMNLTVWTIGHSTRPLKTLLALLEHYRIEAVADVRRFPGSRRQPQYAQGSLSVRLPRMGSLTIGLKHSAGVAGRSQIPRTPRGATSSFAVMPTTSQVKSSKKACRNCSRSLAVFERP